MPVNHNELHRHLADYESVTGCRVRRFVCPITLRECDDAELIDGHILNSALKRASRKTVIQWATVDHFFGTRVESKLTRLLNLKTMSDADLVRNGASLRIVFEDGSEAEAFYASSRRAKSAATVFPIVDVAIASGAISLRAKVPFDDPRITGKCRVVRLEQISLPLCVAGLLKAGYLCLFDMIGYRAVFDPWGDAVRRTLAAYFFDQASAEDAEAHFAEFRYAVRITCHGVDPHRPWVGYRGLDADTIANRTVLLHKSLCGTFFAITCNFHINGLTHAVTMPQGFPNSDPATVWTLYRRLVGDQAGLAHQSHSATLINGNWMLQSTPIPTYVASQAGELDAIR